MIQMKCPICKQVRTHKLHTPRCSELSRGIPTESFISAYKSKYNDADVPKFRERSR